LISNTLSINPDKLHTKITQILFCRIDGGVGATIHPEILVAL